MRREMQSLLIARLDGVGGLLVALVPLRRWTRSAARRAATRIGASVHALVDKVRPHAAEATDALHVD